MNSSVDYYDYVIQWSEKIENLFESVDAGSHIRYVYVYNLGKYRNFTTINIEKSKSKVALLEAWIHRCYSFYSSNPLKYVYENIPIKDLDSYIKITSILVSFLGIDDMLRVSIELFNSYKKSNLELIEFMEVCREIKFIHPNVRFGSEIKIIDRGVREKSIEKISNLWEIWDDYDGEYKSVLEWLPRETLKDLVEL